MSTGRPGPLVPYLSSRQMMNRALARSVQPAEPDPRMKLMLELRAKDHSLRDIGKQVNLSYERVRVLLAREKSNQPATEQGGEAE
jgi:hypothetical protein